MKRVKNLGFNACLRKVIPGFACRYLPIYRLDLPELDKFGIVKVDVKKPGSNFFARGL